MRPVPFIVVFAIAACAFSEELAPAYRGAPKSVQHDARPALIWSAKPPRVVSLDAPPPGVPRAENEIGVIRQLPAASAVNAGSRGLLAFHSAGAERVRLHLKDLSMRDDQTLWVAGEYGPAVAFGKELLAPSGDLWTPSVAGDTITIEWQDGISFAVDSIGHIRAVPASDACYVAAECQSFPDHDALASSIAQMTFARGSSLYICSGGLIHDKKEANNLFLTANHCISTQAEASSVELVWDYANSSCGVHDYQARERTTNGAMLLATSATSDVTLLRVTYPGTRYLMGWTTAPVLAGTSLRRISHPGASNGGVYTQAYAMSSAYGGSATCTALPRPAFLYSSPVVGRNGGGSSGAPVIIDGGQIIGQLYGACGPNPNEPCDPNLAVDGAFAASYDLLKPFLDPAAATQCQTCVPDANTACVFNKRFKVSLRWRNAFVNPPATGVGSVIRYAENTPEINPTYGVLSETVFFSMFPWAPTRVETTVKLFKGVGINNYYWVFAAGLTNNEYWVTVTDTQTCKTWERYNPHGQFSNLVDYEAFPLP